MIRELLSTDQAVWHVGTDSEQGQILCMRPGLLQHQHQKPHFASNLGSNRPALGPECSRQCVNVHPVCQSCAAKLQFEHCSRLNRLELPFVFATAPLAPSNDGARSLAFESRQQPCAAFPLQAAALVSFFHVNICDTKHLHGTVLLHVMW